MALSADRNTPLKDGKLIAVSVAANAKCYAGGLAVANATGYGAPGSAALNLTYLGRFDENKDNTGGADGALNVMVRRKKVFKWKNSGTDAVDQSCLGKVCYIEDDETVSKTDDTGARSQCGIVVGIDSDGVWVE